jgi:hypothetical protein
MTQKQRFVNNILLSGSIYKICGINFLEIKTNWLDGWLAYKP